MSPAFHRFWLKITAIVIGSFGPVFFLGAMIPTSGLARLTLDLLGWRLNHPSSYDALDTRFLSAVTGGFLLGWGGMSRRCCTACTPPPVDGPSGDVMSGTKPCGPTRYLPRVLRKLSARSVARTENCVCSIFRGLLTPPA